MPTKTRAFVVGAPDGRYVQQLATAAPAHLDVRVAPFHELRSELGAGQQDADAFALSAPPHERIFLGGERIQPHDLVWVRSMPLGSLETIVFRMDVLAALQRQGTRVFNSPKALEYAIDKYLSLSLLASAGLPVPQTTTDQTAERAMAAFESLGGDVVVKPLFGAEGRGLIRICDPDHAFRVFKSIESLGQLIYQQAFIPHGGRDYRILFIGQKHWAIERVQLDDWRTNLARGGHCNRYSLPAEVVDIARRATETLGLHYAGVDLVRDPRSETWYLLEVNGVPGWHGIARAFQVDIPAELWHWASHVNVGS